MERASRMPPLNMRACRWASTGRNKFQLALLVPAQPGIDRRQRIGAEPVGPFGALEAIHFDETPYGEDERDQAQ